MINRQKGISTLAALLIAACAVVVMAISYFAYLSRQSTEALVAPVSAPDSPAAKANQPSSQTQSITKTTATGSKTYTNSLYGFSVKYPEKTFKLYTLQNVPPANYHSNIPGVKLIAVDRVDFIDTEKCTIGQSVMTATCTVDSEAGISFVVANNSLRNMVAPFDNLVTSVTIAKKTALLYSTGADGQGTDFYYIPLDSGHTLVISRLYKTDGFPSQTLFNQVIATLTL